MPYLYENRELPIGQSPMCYFIKLLCLEGISQRCVVALALNITVLDELQRVAQRPFLVQLQANAIGQTEVVACGHSIKVGQTQHIAHVQVRVCTQVVVGKSGAESTQTSLEAQVVEITG